MTANIEFYKPEKLDEACRLLAEVPDSKALAGGTDLIVKMRNGLYPDLKAIVDLNSLQLNKIYEDDARIFIGSGCTMTDICNNSLVKEKFPALVIAAGTVGAIQIRNAATLGGNSANASPAGDTIPALYSLGARILLCGPGGKRREIAIENFFAGPGKNKLEKGEIIESFILPGVKTRGAFLKLGERKAHAIAKLNLALSVWEEEGNVKCGIALGSASPTVLRLYEAEKFLEKNGPDLNEKQIEELANLAVIAAKPIDDLRSSEKYRKAMAGVLMKRVLAAIS
ncbi:MAG: FAD binding domain-containing protein [Candidatus Rifleibacteriota bacterium]